MGVPNPVLLQLLLGGHLLADFLLQSRWVARNKGRRPGALLLHGALTWLTHLAVAFPFLGRDLALGLAGLIVVHLLSDLLKARLGPPASLTWFFGDQLVHLGTVVALWAWLSPAAARWGLGTGAGLDLYGRAVLIAGGFAFAGRGGIEIVRGVLARFPSLVPNDETDDPLAMGRVIGVLERFLALTLVLLGQWGALGLVVAAKSVARFRELEDKDFSDYYLIGTLASLLVAVGTGLALRALL